VVDNQINSATATARLKAVVPNAERQLWPNQFVKVRLQLETRKAALVVPNSAIQRGPDGTFVYVVSAEGIATPRHVEIAISQDNQTLLKSGLSKGERVVVEGQAQLRPNAKVIAREQPPSGTGHAAEPAGGGRRRGGKQP
jgi:multidrug efflux system membrane fusion protein